MPSYAKLTPLPLGAIQARGFLRDQLRRSRDGMGGHLPEIEPGMIADPYVRKTHVNAWGEGDQSGWGAEISGNYYTGLVLLAYTLNDPSLIAKAEAWVDAVLQNRKADGYMGTYTEPDAKIYEDYNAWGTACGMRALLYFYEATGREDVFDAVYKCMLWFCDKWAGDKKTSYAGQFITDPMMYCYRKTGDKRLLDFCVDYQRFLCEHDIFLVSHKALSDPRLVYNSEHTAGYVNLMRLPACVYAGSGDETLLRASESGIRKIRAKATQITGGAVCLTEYLAPVSATGETEYCSFAFMNASYAAMSAITGEAAYGDYQEEIVYNGAQGARRKDERAIAYLSAPNQVFATERSSPMGTSMQVYSPCYPVSCCPVNSVMVIPDFVRSMALTDGEGAICVAAYGPCEITHGGVHIIEETLYPFRDLVRFSVRGARKMRLKKPVWCARATVLLDGAAVDTHADTYGYLPVTLPDAGEHKIELSFGMKPEVVRIDDADAANKRPLAFRWGALVFSLPVYAKWEPYYPKTETPLAPEWPWYQAFPAFEDVQGVDPHEMLGLRRNQITWNVAVDEKLTGADVAVEAREIEGYVWSEPPVVLKIPAYKAPYACSAYPASTYEPFGDRLIVTDPMTLTLVPYGCTNLRITYFPRALR